MKGVSIQGVLIVILFALQPLYGQGLIIAHRGASSVAPENTFASIKKALDSNAGMIEIDIRLSKDDSIMVIHDETLDRTTNGSGKVSGYDYSYLRTLSAGYSSKFGSDFENEKIPTLLEVLKMTKNRAGVCIDMKNVPEGLVLNIIHLLEMEQSVYLMSYNAGKLKRTKKQNPAVKTVLIKNILSSVDIAVAKDINAYAVSGGYISPSYVIDNAHSEGIKCWFGIVNDPGKAKNLFEKKVDAVVTNYPQIMIMSREDEVSLFYNSVSNGFELVFLNPGNITGVDILSVNGQIIYNAKPPFERNFTIYSNEIKANGYLLINIETKSEIFTKKIINFSSRR